MYILFSITAVDRQVPQTIRIVVFAFHRAATSTRMRLWQRISIPLAVINNWRKPSSREPVGKGSVTGPLWVWR